MVDKSREISETHCRGSTMAKINISLSQEILEEIDEGVIRVEFFLSRPLRLLLLRPLLRSGASGGRFVTLRLFTLAGKVGVGPHRQPDSFAFDVDDGDRDFDLLMHLHNVGWFFDELVGKFFQKP